MSGAVAILRSWGGEGTLAAARRLASSGVLERVIVVLDVAEDRAATAAALGKMPAVSIAPVTNAGWSAALNAGLAAAKNADVVVAISFSVTIAPDDLRALCDAARREGTSAAFVTFAGRSEPTYRLPRNTCAAWPKSLLDRAGGFDEAVDALGGMEDWDRVLAAYRDEGRLPVLAARDVALVAPRPDELAPKLAREERAVRAIDARYPPEIAAAVRAHVGEALARR